jgi:hypothetical protein
MAPQTKLPSFTDAEIRRVLAAAKASKTPLGLEIEPTGLLGLRPLIPMDVLDERERRLGHLLGQRGARRGRR